MFRKEITEIGNALGLEGTFMLQFGFDHIMQAINGPPPEMEEVDATRYAVYENGRFINTVDDPKMCVDGQVLVRLTGSFLRLKPQPVTRSVTVKGYIDETGDVFDCKDTCVETGDYPFKAHSELFGKNVTLTATWTEPCS